MGAHGSKVTEFIESNYMAELISENHIAPSRIEFWDTFLGYSGLTTNSQEIDLDSRIESLCNKFISHNIVSGNFGSLVLVFLKKTQEHILFLEQSSNSCHTLNALIIIKTIVKCFVGTKSEYDLLRNFEFFPFSNCAHESEEKLIEDVIHKKTNTQKQLRVSRSIFDEFFQNIVNILVVIPIKECNYFLHLEAVNVIIILLSVHFFSQNSHKNSEIYKTIYSCKNANLLSYVLLHFVAHSSSVPDHEYGTSYTGSIVIGFAESLLSILTFRRSQNMLFLQLSENIDQEFRQRYPLANQSILLLLILLNHNTANGSPYRMSIFNCLDHTSSTNTESTLKINFTKLYDTLCQIVMIDHATLLLYLLLHRNSHFYKFVTSCSNVEHLVLPILRILYDGPNNTSHHIYMTLIILLILSEDDEFNKKVHQIVVKNVAWYTERTFAEISLGGLLILVVIRTIQHNILKVHDKYLHTNCLAALANMANQFRHLHPYVAQRLISLFETLSKKYIKLNKTKESISGSLNLVANKPEGVVQDIAVLEDVLRMLLEIINACLATQLVHCPNLIYTLLYKKHVFESLRSHCNFRDIIQNIEMVVGFFSSKLQRVQEQRGVLGVDEVLQAISKGATQWSSDRLRKFPDLKFKYVEESEPESFFIPYLWTLVCKYGCVHLKSDCIERLQLYNNVL